MDAVLRYLEKVDPAAAARARYRYSCFDHFGEDLQAYGYAASFDLSASCEKEVLSQVLELQKQTVADPEPLKHVRSALEGSFEHLFHTMGLAHFLLFMRNNNQLRAMLREPRLERAIGVIYRPKTERQSHYFRAKLCDQFDAVLHFDHTQAVIPLEYA